MFDHGNRMTRARPTTRTAHRQSIARRALRVERRGYEGAQHTSNRFQFPAPSRRQSTTTSKARRALSRSAQGGDQFEAIPGSMASPEQ